MTRKDTWRPVCPRLPFPCPALHPPGPLHPAEFAAITVAIGAGVALNSRRGHSPPLGDGENLERTGQPSLDHAPPPPSPSLVSTIPLRGQFYNARPVIVRDCSNRSRIGGSEKIFISAFPF